MITLTLMEGSQGEPTTEQRQKFDQNNPRCLWSEVRRFSKRHKKAHVCSRPSFMIMLSHEMPSLWCKSSCSGENIREVRWGFGYCGNTRDAIKQAQRQTFIEFLLIQLMSWIENHTVHWHRHVAPHIFLPIDVKALTQESDRDNN